MDSISSKALPAQPISPKSVRVDKTGGTGMDIEWPGSATSETADNLDGPSADHLLRSAPASHHSHFSFQYLRLICPCATCDDEREKSGRDFDEPPASPAGALPMYKDPAHPTEVHPVGRYAISFVWNDGHRTGIYSWEFLRTWCPCAECRAVRETNKNESARTSANQNSANRSQANQSAASTDSAGEKQSRP